MIKIVVVLCIALGALWHTAASVADDAALPHLTRLTGADMPACVQWQVCGTDLGIPYLLENNSVGYLFGDTFASRNPEHTTLRGWRSPVMLRSHSLPAVNSPIAFDNAAGARNGAQAPSVMWNGKTTAGEFTVIPNDGLSIPELGLEVISYQSVQRWNSPNGAWQTNYSGLAWSTDGTHFVRDGPLWPNGSDNSDPFQMMSLQRDGNFVYAISVRAGRQQGPMMLQRVRSNEVLVRSAWQCWDGSDWSQDCHALLNGTFGEPSLRKLADGTWVMAYLNASAGTIVTRTAATPTGPWSAEQTQLGWWQVPNLYGGFIHPYSTKDNLTLMVSTWQRRPDGYTTRYDVMQFNSRLSTSVTSRD